MSDTRPQRGDPHPTDLLLFWHRRSNGTDYWVTEEKFRELQMQQRRAQAKHLGKVSDTVAYKERKKRQLRECRERKKNA